MPGYIFSFASGVMRRFSSGGVILGRLFGLEKKSQAVSRETGGNSVLSSVYISFFFSLLKRWPGKPDKLPRYQEQESEYQGKRFVSLIKYAGGHPAHTGPHEICQIEETGENAPVL